MQEFLRNSNPTSWRVLLVVKIMCNYSEEQNKFLTQENGEPVLRALLRERMYILAFLTAFTCFRPQRAKPHTQFPLRMIAYHACWFPQSYFGEQACFHSPVGYFFFYFFTPPAPTSLLFAFMRFLTILRLVIQIVVSDRETLFAVFLARDVGDFAE